MSTATVTTRSSVYSIRPDGIAVQRNLPGIVQTVADVHENIAIYDALVEERPRLLLVDTRELEGQESGVREAYSSPAATRMTVAIAIVANMSGPGRVVSNLFIALSAPPVPTRLFADEDAAIEWLKKIGRAKGM